MNLFFFLVACNVALRISLTLFLVPAYATSRYGITRADHRAHVSRLERGRD